MKGKWKERIKKWKHEHEFSIRLIWVVGASVGLVVLIASLEAGGFDVFGWLFSGRGGFVTVIVLILLLSWIPYYLYSGKKIDSGRKGKDK